MLLFRSLSFYLAILGIVVGVAYVLYSMRPYPKMVPIAKPSATPYQKTIAATGIVEAQNRNIFIGSPVPGLVDDYFVKVGDKVQKGDLLFTIDGRDLKAQLEVREADVEVAEADLDKLEDQLARYEKVKDPRAVSVDEVRTKRFEVQAAKKRLKEAVAKVHETEALIERLEITAPQDGVILQNNLRKGEYFQSGNMGPAMVLGDLERLQIRADIDEQNASQFFPGAQAVAFPKNNTTEMIPLTFSYVEPYVIPKRSLTGSGEERVDTRVLQVIYTFKKPKNLNIYIGQQVDVFINAEQEAQPE